MGRRSIMSAHKTERPEQNPSNDLLSVWNCSMPPRRNTKTTPDPVRIGCCDHMETILRITKRYKGRRSGYPPR